MLPTAAEIRTKRGQVLVVDDDRAVRRSLAKVLETIGLTAHEAETGAEAMAMLDRFDDVPLVVTDIYMPEMDGLALLEQVLRRRPDTAVLVLTGVAEVSTAVEALQRGAYDYLAKPILIEEFKTRVEKALERRRLSIENRFLQQTYQQRLESQVRELARRNQEQFLGQIQMAVQMLEKKDQYTRGHSRRVSHYAVKTAVMMGLSGNWLDQIRLGGELHDIGKIGTRDLVLNKAGPLSPEEFDHIKLHVVEGEEILEPLRRDHPVVLEIVRSHHERMDGSGFPDGLTGDAIPVGARLVAVADAFDAMTTNRSYRPCRPVEDAMEELARCAGRQFDPDAVSAFRRSFPDLSRLPLAV
jgi:putative nucleotidyltransferase with HDIG domain